MIELPPGMLGVLNDMGFLFMENLGAAGPDKGKGGKYLVLPPGYEGDIPDGYFVVKSRTYGVWNFMRGYLDKGIEAAANNIRDNLKVYPLSKAGNQPGMEFINVSGKNFNTIVSSDYSFYEKLNTLIQEEPIEFLDIETRGLIRSIGIVKGKPFNPDARMKKILTDAIAIGEATARSITYYPRDPGQYAWGDTEGTWVVPFADHDSSWIENGARKIENQIYYHYNCIVVTPAMAAAPGPGKGSEYVFASLDSEERILEGSKNYKMTFAPRCAGRRFLGHHPVRHPDPIAAADRPAVPDPGHVHRGIEEKRGRVLTIYFGPTAPEGQESNWLQTVPEKSFFVCLRMYGPTEPWIEGEWRPSDVELVE